MDIVENTLQEDLETVLARPLFCFLATVDDGAPRVSPLWFRWEDGAVWMIADSHKTYPDRVEREPRTALAIVDFDRSTGAVVHVGMRGRATVEPHDSGRAERLLAGYLPTRRESRRLRRGGCHLGPNVAKWDESRFPDPREWGDRMVTIRFDPETVVARDQSYAVP